MTRFFGRVSVEKVNIGSKSEYEAFMLAGTDGQMRELRTKVPMPIFFLDPESSMFWPFIGKDVEVEGDLFNSNVILVTRISIVRA